MREKEEENRRSQLVPRGEEGSAEARGGVESHLDGEPVPGTVLACAL
jgi:hypothetical protein